MIYWLYCFVAKGKGFFMLIEIGIMEVRVDLWINYQNFGTSFGRVKNSLIICVFILNHKLYKEGFIEREIDFIPKLILSNGKLVKIFSKTKIQKYLKLEGIDEYVIYHKDKN